MKTCLDHKPFGTYFVPDPVVAVEAEGIIRGLAGATAGTSTTSQ